MAELGQLEKHFAEFDARGVRVVAASLDDVADTAETQKRFEHLTVVSDAEKSLTGAAAVIGPHHGPTGEETVSPTTVLIDPTGRVRWVFRPDRYLTRLSPQELLAAIDEHLHRGR
ncbi:MAG TPA: redoxin domain-containing protein [Gemmataceae bacterium]|jgi:peroxiredoxin